MPYTVPSARDTGVKTDMSPLTDTSKFYYKVNIKKVQRCFKVYQNYRCFYFLGKIASYLYSIQSGRNCTTPFMCLAAQSCPTLCDSMDWSPPGSSVHGDSPCKSTGMGFHALLKKWSLGRLFLKNKIGVSFMFYPLSESVPSSTSVTGTAPALA